MNGPRSGGKKRGRQEPKLSSAALACGLFCFGRLYGEQQGDAEPPRRLADPDLGLHLFHHGPDADKAHLGAFGAAGLGRQRDVGKGQAGLLPLPHKADLDRVGRVGIFEDVGGDVVEDAPDVGPVDLQDDVLATKSSKCNRRIKENFSRGFPAQAFSWAGID